MARVFDIGFYTFSDVLPACPYFCRLNLHDNENLEGMANQVIENGQSDFVITANNHVTYEELLAHYELVLTVGNIPLPYEEQGFFNLYQRVR